jgi:hypothetical protein
MTDTPDTPVVEEPVELAPIEPEAIHPVDPNVIKPDPNATDDDDEASARRGRRDRSE